MKISCYGNQSKQKEEAKKLGVSINFFYFILRANDFSMETKKRVRWGGCVHKRE